MLSLPIVDNGSGRQRLRDTFVLPPSAGDALVPRFHFNVYDGVDLLDAKGTELPDANFARREAIRYSGALLEDGASKDSLGEDWRMEVTNADGLLLFRLDFYVTEAPAARDLKPKAK